MGEPLARDHLETFLAQPAEDIDATLARVIGLLESLRSDDATPVAATTDTPASDALAELVAQGYDTCTCPADVYYAGDPIPLDDCPIHGDQTVGANVCTCPDRPTVPPGAVWDVYVDPACPLHAEVRR